MVQLGVGMTNGILVTIGGLLGALVYTNFPKRRLEDEEPLESAHMQPGTVDSPGKAKDIATALSIEPLTMILLWVPICLAIIAFANLYDQGRVTPTSFSPPAIGGLFIGFAQAATVLLTRHHIGASGAYEDLARWIDYHLFVRHGDSEAVPSFITPSIIFSAGMAVAAAALNHSYLPVPPPDSIKSSSSNLGTIALTLAGGASMVLGARLAGGE